MSRRMRVQVKPGSRRGQLVEVVQSDDADFVVHVRERPVDGRANAAVERVVAAHLGVPKSHVTVVRGHRSRIKTLEVDR